jgi:hypothetical protein
LHFFIIVKKFFRRSVEQMENRSELARIGVQIDLELDALERFMHGTAIVARHTIISHCLQQPGGCMEDLAGQVGEEAAIEEIYEKYSHLHA